MNYKPLLDKIFNEQDVDGTYVNYPSILSRGRLEKAIKEFAQDIKAEEVIMFISDPFLISHKPNCLLLKDRFYVNIRGLKNVALKYEEVEITPSVIIVSGKKYPHSMFHHRYLSIILEKLQNPEFIKEASAPGDASEQVINQGINSETQEAPVYSREARIAEFYKEISCQDETPLSPEEQEEFLKAVERAAIFSRILYCDPDRIFAVDRSGALLHDIKRTMPQGADYTTRDRLGSNVKLKYYFPRVFYYF